MTYFSKEYNDMICFYKRKKTIDWIDYHDLILENNIIFFFQKQENILKNNIIYIFFKNKRTRLA